MGKDPAFLFYNSKLRIKELDWKTPNTYSQNFASIPPKPGVYLLVGFIFDKPSFIIKEKSIIYVGSSKNLKLRHRNHEVIRILSEIYDYMRFYFKEYEDFRNEEKRLINIIKPKFNKQHNT